MTIRDDDRICEKHERGQQIELACQKHPHLRWSTKNISHIGARKIFFDLDRKATEPECPCPASLLIHVCA